MLLGESDRAIAKAGPIGRKKAKSVRELASANGWLDPDCELPDDALLAASFQSPATRPQAVSLVEPYADQVTRWWENGIQGTTIHQALKRKYGLAMAKSSQSPPLEDKNSAEIAQKSFNPQCSVSDLNGTWFIKALI